MKAKTKPPVTQSQRLNLVVGEKTKARLADLQARIGSTSLTETIRRSVELMDVVSAAQEQGATLLIEGRDGARSEIKILF